MLLYMHIFKKTIIAKVTVMLKNIHTRNLQHFLCFSTSTYIPELGSLLSCRPGYFHFMPLHLVQI